MLTHNGPRRLKPGSFATLRKRTATLRQVADAVVAAGLSLGGKRGKALNKAYDHLRKAVEAAYPEAGRGATKRARCHPHPRTHPDS